MNEIIAKISASSSVAIRSTEAKNDLSQPLYAVNWFDASPAWLYHLYNKLASRSVYKIGGQPLFKATVKDSILSDKGKRQILLIVKYPDGNAFKKLLESTYFKLVSILRIMAVKRFTFSFTKPEAKLNLKQKYKAYALHHFDNRQLSEVLEGLKNEQSDVDIIYTGQTFAHLIRQSKGEAEVPVRNIIDSVIIYGGTSEEALATHLKSEKYLAYFDTENPGYISSINRIF